MRALQLRHAIVRLKDTDPKQGHTSVKLQAILTWTECHEDMRTLLGMGFSNHHGG